MYAPPPGFCDPHSAGFTGSFTSVVLLFPCLCGIKKCSRGINVDFKPFLDLGTMEKRRLFYIVDSCQGF